LYKAVIFDLDNTLLNYDLCESDSMRLTGRKHGLEQWERFTWELFWEAFAPINWVYWSERIERKLTIHQVLEYSFRDTLKRLEWDSVHSVPLARTYWEHFCELCHFEDGAQELLTELHGSRKLAVISNGIGEAQRKRTASGNIAHLFDSFIISDEVGFLKPDRSIFEIALGELGLDRTEVLYIGDSLEIDGVGASNAGIDFCFYNRGRLPVQGPFVPQYAIERLSELPAVIASKG